MLTKKIYAVIHNGVIIAPEGDRLIDDNDYLEFTIRSITRKEYKDWVTLSIGDRFDFEDLVLEKAVLKHPTHFLSETFSWDILYAGIPSQVVEEVLDLSGLSDKGPSQEALDIAAEYLNSEVAKYDQLIILARDCYKVSEIEDLHPDDWHKEVGQSYNKLKLLGINPDEIISGGTNKEKEKMAEALRRAEEYSQNLLGPATSKPGAKHHRETEFTQSWGGN